MTEARALRCDGAKAHAAPLLLQSAKYPTDMTSKVIMGPDICDVFPEIWRYGCVWIVKKFIFLGIQALNEGVAVISWG